MNWQFRGSPIYLNAQGDRLGLSRVLIDRARHCAELHRIAVLLGQLNERYRRSLGADGQPVLFPPERAQVLSTLAECDREMEKLHAIAASAQAMADEAYAAFGLAPPERAVKVWCAYDADPAANGEAEAPAPAPVKIKSKTG